MTANILVVTSSTSFGEAVRRTIEETDVYRVHIVNNKASAVVRADEYATPLALLDISLGEDWVLEIGQALRTIRPQINLVVLCGSGVPPALDGIRPWVLVRKPFHVADLMNALNQQPPSAATAVASTNLPWLSDPAKAAQHLTRLTLESSAQAALITQKNDLWAYAGGLSQSAAKEVAQTVTRNWDGQKGSDLLRFIRLESTKAEHMLYATRLAADVVLALVFDAETPFSTIRSQANQLITNIGSERPDVQKSPAPLPQPSLEFTEEQLDEEDDVEIPAITDILTNIPAPNPPPSASTRDLKEAQPQETSDAALGVTRISAPLSDASVFTREESPSIPLNHLVTVEQPKGQKENALPQAMLDEIEVTAPSKSRRRPETPVVKPAPGEMDVTRASATTEAARKVTFEPTTAGLYHLTYACLLVPRFSSHYLTGDLADRLSEWLPNICVAFGWRLEFLAVRPEYLQWVVNVQPNTSPGYLMRVMRQQTSEKIFNDFGRLKKENPSGDFWAPGYLIMGGTQPHPPQLVRDYIRQTRQRQGQEALNQRH
ncbi:MAG: transposase [Chloroflexi bacterium]|nr:transposase [Chloroflexota bacterium]